MAMTRKAVETLLVLVENAGQVVPKEELLNAIWPDRVVDEANLTQNIAMVRRAIGAERGTAAYIETFPGRGYRLLGPVETDQLEKMERAESESENEAPEMSSADNSTSAPIAESLAFGTPSAMFAQSKPSEESRKQDVGQSGVSQALLARTGRLAMVLATAAIVIVAVGWFFLQRTVRTSEAVFRVAPFTRLPGKEWQPVISPDGKKVAFLWEQDNGQAPDIRVQTAGESTPKQISREEGHYSSPAWSPDSSALSYLRIGRSATEVLIASLQNDSGTNGTERLVTRFTPPNYGIQYRLLDWSPDGQWLAVSHSDSPDKPNGLFLVNIATGEKTALTKPVAMVGGDMDPHFSPDGKTISFIRNIHRTHQEIYSIPTAGGTPKQLTADGKQISGHDWMSDENGEGVVVYASDRSGEFRLWKLRADVASPTKNPQSVGVYAEFPIELSLSRKSPLLVYSVQQQDRNIWRLDFKEKKWTRIVASSAQDASPQYSPAGDKICFRSDRSGEEQLWVSDAEGNNQTQITKGALYPSVGHWSPDGRWIAFNNARTSEMFLAALADDGSWTVRATGIVGVHPIFSPDGQWIYAGTTKSIIKVPAKISANGGAVSEVVKTGGFSLGVSNDGKLLYFMREPNDTVLWQARIDTGELSKALDGLLPNCTSCWALAQDGIYFLGSGKQSFDTQVVYFHDFAAGHDREILRYPEPLAPVGSGPFSLSPNLRSLLCVRVDPSNSDIMMVEPFR